ncbi:MAG: site-specific DNA-methyltransferase [Acidimicrobiaceae bacterium]|nr:site-specific DNA-methyltransferase [Acidimicrobiaceae bacterium]MYA73060.1 site-specific DNA-methyltransferase [Acidimicrobiaceae bacterium]MYC41103.1 site-specific DNA-methyltransferase [Acidimicrobiaceae bacterium]MYG55125.1 site-specific DNA-methyltransferase [Acidimicrobiaceae bacterium]MYJ98140.1 site-specific DNA-methyltransferase [Acidimicrobiaceae bacterium]
MSGSERSRGGTSTSSFGVGRREGHDASAFYDRFPAPEISDDDRIAEHSCRDQLWVGDARDMDSCGKVADGSVALVVTSPPYFAGKEYEEALGEGHVPADYLAYLDMLEAVFAECVRKLEPGGRIAVNVANLGRRPYRSLSGDVVQILQDRLRLLLRGEVIWVKAKGAAGNCAWGSFREPANPVLRDLTERVVIASKGRLDRARPVAQRADEGLPSEATAPVEEFMEATTDVWEIPPASATRVGHPAPFPVELPKRLIELYTYRGDLVLDPFMGAGTTAVAALRTGRHYVGFDTDAAYIATAEKRITAEREELAKPTDELEWPVTVPRGRQLSFAEEFGDLQVSTNGRSTPAERGGDFQARAGREGRKAQEMAHGVLKNCGFTVTEVNVVRAGGVEVNFVALDQQGEPWLFDVSGAFSVTKRPGLRRTDTLWKALGRASVLHSSDPSTQLVLLTTDRPLPNSSGDRALREVTGPDKPVRDVICMLSQKDLDRLKALAAGTNTTAHE